VYQPTARQVFAEVQETAVSSLCGPPGVVVADAFGEVWIDHFDPFQSSMRVKYPQPGCTAWSFEHE
jgi:hypothetical protein